MVSGTANAGSEAPSAYYIEGMPRHLPIIQHSSESAERLRPSLVRILVASAAWTLLFWAPLAAGAQWLGRILVRWCVGGDAVSVADWVARTTDTQRWAVSAVLFALALLSYVFASLLAGAVTSRSFVGADGRKTALGVSLAGTIGWALAALRFEVGFAVASLVVLFAMGFGFGWLGHRLACSRLDDRRSRR